MLHAKTLNLSEHTAVKLQSTAQNCHQTWMLMFPAGRVAQSSADIILKSFNLIKLDS